MSSRLLSGIGEALGKAVCQTQSNQVYGWEKNSSLKPLATNTTAVLSNQTKHCAETLFTTSEAQKHQNNDKNVTLSYPVEFVYTFDLKKRTTEQNVFWYKSGFHPLTDITGSARAWISNILLLNNCFIAVASNYPYMVKVNLDSEIYITL